MTREEARQYLTDISYDIGNMGAEYLSEKHGEKMRECIKALEQEPSEDAISRQAAIDVLRTCYDTHIVQYEEGGDYINYEDAVNGIESLRSVIPTRPKGEWILLDECSNSGYYCSNCHKKVVKEGWSDTVKKNKILPELRSGYER